MSDTPKATDGARRYAIDVQVDEAYAGDVSAEALTAVATRVLTRLEQPDAAGLTIVVTDDDQVRALNRTYRDEDSATDVLSFAATEGEGFVLPDDAPPYLGDVIISFPTALAQANAQGQPVEAELRLLVAHGCLHLLVYDHATPEEEATMWALQADVLAGA